MPSLFGRKLFCFYCGSRSTQQYSPGLRRWECRKCEAENWLDQNGEITEPPANASTSTQTRYVQAKLTTDPVTYLDPVTPTVDKPLFCPTCLKNQHLYTESLASFYPSATQNRIEEFERVEREYRQGLEERYPLICEACAPRVEDRLRRVNYDAKADHMGRVMRNLREGRTKNAKGPAAWLVWTGGWAWTLSWAVDLTWHIMSLLPTSDPYVVYGKSTFNGCIRHSIAACEVMPTCLNRFGHGPVYYGLLVGFATIWWHPRRMEVINKRYGRVMGSSEYYKLQILALGTRMATWYFMTRESQGDLQAQQPIHLFMIAFSLIIIAVSYKAVSVDYTPKVSFTASPEPLVKRKPTSIHDQPQPPLQRGTDPINRSHPFSINDLAPPSQQTAKSTRLPTPPPEADYDDAATAMDWTPSTTTSSNFSPMNSNRYPASYHNTKTTTQAQPSPFRGHLPADVVSPAHRLRNPPNKPTFRAASEAKKAQLFPKNQQSNQSYQSRLRTRPTGHPLDLTSLSQTLDHRPSFLRDDASDISDFSTASAFDDLSPTKGFAQPKFFPKGQAGGGDDQTGLETIMEHAFRIDETPREVLETKERELQVQGMRERRRNAIVWRAIVGIVALVGVMIAVVFYQGFAGDDDRINDELAGWKGNVKRGVRWFLDV